jgi:serine/threonine-protein kinase
MAELFLAKDTRDDRLVVLKRILPCLAEEAEFVRMFLDEARIAASLHHANIVEVYELGRLDGSIFIAMEWVDGVDLRKLLAKEQERGGVVPPGVAAWLVARLCEGLHYAHFRTGPDGKPLGIIHRDVSPQNVMVSFNADVKLVDFGIAKATAWMRRSKPGVIKGKFLYLAPEQLGQDKIDHRSDLFAIGTVLYELTTGKSPFYRSSTEAVIYAIKMENPPAPHTVRPGYPMSLSRVVMKCLERDRDRRYQTADEIRAALENFMRVDAPTTRNDVIRYVAGLFGAEDERTSIYIPPNALPATPGAPEGSTDQTRPALPSAGAGPQETTDVSGFEGVDEERTAPVATSPMHAAAKLPEGRQPTAETQSIPGKPEPTEVTAPVPSPVKAARDAATTSVLEEPPVQKVPGYQTAGTGDIEETAVSMSGARDLKVGDVLPELLPTGEFPRWNDESEASLRPIDPDLDERRPGPPLPSGEGEIPEISDVSLVSAGEATLAVDAGESPPTPTPEPPRRAMQEQRKPAAAEARRSQVLSQLPSAKGADARPPGSKLPETRVADPRTAQPRRPGPQPDRPTRRRPATAQAKRKLQLVGDPDDLIDTVDMANADAFDEPSRGGEDDRRHQLILLGIVGAGALLVVVLLAWILWPSSTPAPDAPRPPKVEQAQQPARPVPVRIQINAPKGTSLAIDGVSILAGDVRVVTPGKLTIDYRCPARKKQPPKDEQITVDVVAGDGGQTIDIPCR